MRKKPKAVYDLHIRASPESYNGVHKIVRANGWTLDKFLRLAVHWYKSFQSRDDEVAKLRDELKREKVLREDYQRKLSMSMTPNYDGTLRR